MNWDDVAYFVQQAVNTKVCQVTPSLFIGSAYFEQDHLEEHGITHVLNVSDVDDHDWVKKHLGYKWNWMEDDGEKKDPVLWYRTIDWAIPVLEEGGLIYVHCSAGVNRSAGHMYLILRELGHAPNEAWSLIEKARPQVRPRYVIQVERFLGGE